MNARHHLTGVAPLEILRHDPLVENKRAEDLLGQSGHGPAHQRAHIQSQLSATGKAECTQRDLNGKTCSPAPVSEGLTFPTVIRSTSPALPCCGQHMEAMAPLLLSTQLAFSLHCWSANSSNMSFVQHLLRATIMLAFYIQDLAPSSQQPSDQVL